jgi:hypothetical protein
LFAMVMDAATLMDTRLNFNAIGRDRTSGGVGARVTKSPGALPRPGL